MGLEKIQTNLLEHHTDLYHNHELRRQELPTYNRRSLLLNNSW